MRTFYFFVALIVAMIAMLLFGCAGAPPIQGATAEAPAPTIQNVDLSATPLAKFTHADLQQAASYATGNGYPARAAVYLAIDAQLTACEKAISTLKPTIPTGTVGAFTAFEIAAENVGKGVPATVKLNCEPVTLPSGFILPKLP